MQGNYYLLILLLCIYGSLKAQTDCQPAELTSGQFLQGNAYRAYFLPDAGTIGDQEEFEYAIGYDDPVSGPIGTIFGQNLWLAYEDEGVIGLAEGTYLNGGVNQRSYYPGPLSDDGTAIPGACDDFERIWQVSGNDIAAHLADFNDNQIIDDPIPSVMGWPGTGNPNFAQYNGFELVGSQPQNGLAPFFDANENGIYEPASGEYPVEPKDLTIPSVLSWSVANTVAGGGVITVQGATNFPLEIQQVAWAYDCAETSLLNSSLFIRYKITYRDEVTVPNVRLGLWVDPDLGCFTDDYIGSVPDLNTFYVYNEDNLDGDENGNCLSGVVPAGENPPVQSVTLLNQEMASLIYTNNGAVGNWPIETQGPNTAQEFYNYLSGRWRDGSPMRAAGDGYGEDPTAPITEYAFSGFPGQAANWNALNAELPAADRRMVAAVNKSELLPGEILNIDVAYAYHRQPGLDHVENVAFMLNNVAELQALYDDGFDQALCEPTICTTEDDCVWPGDMNADGIANHLDLVALGFGLGTTGPDRSGNNAWAPKSVDDWPQNQLLGPNNKHLDANGNGEADLDDFNKTIDFYDFTRLGYQLEEDVFTDGTDLRFIIGSNLDDVVLIEPSQFFSGRVLLNTSQQDLRAIAFQLEFDPAFYEEVLAFGNNLEAGNISYAKNAEAGRYDVTIYNEEELLAPNQNSIVLVMPTTILGQPVEDFPALQTEIRFKNIRAWLIDGTEVSLGSGTTTLTFEPVSVEEPFWAESIEIFPNPVGEILHISAPNAELSSWVVLDALGREVLKSTYASPVNTATLPVNTTSFPSGTYFIRLANEDGTMVTRKFVKL